MINEKNIVNIPKKSTPSDTTINDEKKLILNPRANVTQKSVVIGGKEFLVVQPEKTTIVKKNESANQDNKSKDEKELSGLQRCRMHLDQDYEKPMSIVHALPSCTFRSNFMTNSKLPKSLHWREGPAQYDRLTGKVPTPYINKD